MHGRDLGLCMFVTLKMTIAKNEKRKYDFPNENYSKCIDTLIRLTTTINVGENSAVCAAYCASSGNEIKIEE